MTPEEPQTPQPRRMPGPKNPQEAEEWARHSRAAQYSQEEMQQLIMQLVYCNVHKTAASANSNGKLVTSE